MRQLSYQMRQKTVIKKLLQSATEVYYKVRQVFQSVSSIAKSDRLLLQNAEGIIQKVIVVTT